MVGIKVVRLTTLLVCLGIGCFLYPGSSRAGEAPHTTQIRVLSYNVHGLPFFWTRAGSRTTRIGANLGDLEPGYDVVFVQEAFRKKQVDNLAGASDWTSLRGNGGRPSKAKFLGSGLALMVAPTLAGDLDSQMGDYSKCSGWVRGLNDCFSNKGWLHIRLKLPSGEPLHLISTHLDAASGNKDKEARASQLLQLAKYINSETEDEPLILAGDFNIGFKGSEHNDRIMDFRFSTGLQDTNARPPMKNCWGNRIDYIFYRTSTAVILKVEDKGVDEVVSGKCERSLSDHPPIYAVFSVTTSGTSSSPRD